MAAFNLTFIRRNTRFFTFVCFATYSKAEEVRTLNLEASTRYKIRTAGIFLKFDPLRIYTVTL